MGFFYKAETKLLTSNSLDSKGEEKSSGTTKLLAYYSWTGEILNTNVDILLVIRGFFHILNQVHELDISILARI